MDWRWFAAATSLFVLAGGPALAQWEDAKRLEAPCARGEALACANLATLYKHGRGVARDDVRALTYFVTACEKGSKFACGNVGEMAILGRGIAPDKAVGAAILKSACRRGDPWSCETAERLGLNVRKDRARRAQSG
jgi:hypothetical protein